MGRKKAHTPEQIVAKLRQVEVLAAQGKAVAEAVRAIGVSEPTYYRGRGEDGGAEAARGRGGGGAVRAIGVSEPTYYRWRAEYGGLKLDQVKRLKQPEAENARLRKAVADLTLEKVILKEAASGNF